jgi:hypothetical protein
MNDSDRLIKWIGDKSKAKSTKSALNQKINFHLQNYLSDQGLNASVGETNRLTGMLKELHDSDYIDYNYLLDPKNNYKGDTSPSLPMHSACLKAQGTLRYQEIINELASLQTEPSKI